jgi:amino acid efflux transporter
VEHAAAGLARRITLPQAVALYVGAVLGSGVLLVPGYAAEAAGPASILVWFLMALLALPMALTLGALATRHPDAGGVSAYVRQAFGPRLAAVTGWLFLASVPIGTPVAALAAASYAQVALGLSHGVTFAIAFAIIGVALLNNFLGTDFLGRSQVVITGLICALLVVAIGVAAPHVEGAQFQPFAPHGFLGMGQAAALMFWCFIGWEAVSHMAEEFANPERDTNRAIWIAALVVGLLYTLVGWVTVGTGSYGGAQSNGSLALIVTRFLGPAGGLVVAGVALFIAVGVCNAYLGAAARLAYSLGREGVAPAVLGRLHPVRRTPAAAIGFVGVIALGVLAAQALGGADLRLLLALPNSTFMGTYLLGSAAAIRLLSGRLRVLGWVSLVLSVFVYLFLGWAALYAPVVGILVWLAVGRKRS